MPKVKNSRKFQENRKERKISFRPVKSHFSERGRTQKITLPRLKILCPSGRAGSIPALSTKRIDLERTSRKDVLFFFPLVVRQAESAPVLPLRVGFRRPIVRPIAAPNASKPRVGRLFLYFCRFLRFHIMQKKEPRTDSLT